MTDHGYDAVDDAYCYKGSRCLRNRAGIRDSVQLEAFEHEMVTLRGEEPLPKGKFTPAHYKRVHRHLFQDVYAWAGRRRTVRIAKGESVFCYPENIDAQLEKLFQRFNGPELAPGADFGTFVRALSAFLSDLNAIHAFRDGNGRTQLAFAHLIARRAGHPLDFARVMPKAFLAAMIASFNGNNEPLARELAALRA